MKNSRKGQAAIWDSNVIRKMRSRLKSPQQRLIFEISLFTGERIGAICQLKVSDIYGKNGSILGTITFAGSTRKGSKHGSANTRQVPIHPDLLHHLERYQPPGNGYLFPSNSATGHITSRAVDKYWRAILLDQGLTGFITHSSCRNLMRFGLVEESKIKTQTHENCQPRKVIHYRITPGRLLGKKLHADKSFVT
jgi:integrase/recombinase XerD